MATIEIESGRLPAKRQAVGETVVVAKVSLSASYSAGDTFRIAKIPHGAILTDAVLYPGAAHAAALVAKCGTSASAELLFASATYSIATRTTLGLGYRVAGVSSLSDEAAPRYDWLTFTPTAGVSIGHVCDIVVRYMANPSA